ncbi:SSI family serine proteinase inhibitor [Actinoplanes sp. CA-030573]|uniref:SSI family serine proteinase inhibitor n=1 Tax=Actinoplanes sp. CA-030573 TaxID=3239898 RepID=UPI003D8B73F7
MIPTMIGLVAAVLAAGPPGGYGDGGGRGEPESKLTVSYMADAGFASAVKLECGPAGGGHPRAAAACAELTAVGGDLDKIEPAHTACILIYQPVTAEVTGEWRGTTVQWKHRYGNSCEMRRALGALVAF